MFPSRALCRALAAIALLAQYSRAQTTPEIARSLQDHSEYVAYSEITRTADPEEKREASEKFLDRYKGSRYQSAVEDLYLQGWQLAAAKTILAQDDSNLIALEIVADTYLQNEKEPRKLMAYARKILAVLDEQPDQEGFASVEWTARKALLTGRAHWMMGAASIRQHKYERADKSLRAALPYLKDDSHLLSSALFDLSWANYQLGKLADAIRFSKECTLVNGPYQAKAVKRLQEIGAQVASLNRNQSTAE